MPLTASTGKKCMNGAASVFVDTNVLLYSVDISNPVKRQRGGIWMQHLWDTGSGRLSWQVLHEFYVNATRKLKHDAEGTRRYVKVLTEWQPVDTSFGLIQQAWRWTEEAQLSYWDALIMAAAERSGCKWLLSEDFQAGRKYGEVTIVNPFEQTPETIAES